MIYINCLCLLVHLQHEEGSTVYYIIHINDERQLVLIQFLYTTYCTLNASWSFCNTCQHYHNNAEI